MYIPIRKYLKFVSGPRSLKVLILFIIVFLIIAVTLSVLSARNMKRIINEDFNSQQLELARHAAGILSENFKVLKRELITLSLSPSIQYIEKVSWANRMKITFSSVREYGVFKIMLVNGDGDAAYTVDYTNDPYVENRNFSFEPYMAWSKYPVNNSKIFMSSVRKGTVMASETGFVKAIATPVYQTSIDEAHPEPTSKFNGVLVFLLDTEFFAKKVAGSIRSGKTGYAWVIDETGQFLYHLEKEFIGENAFEARQHRDPHISFSKINLIQKELMLQGKEGTSWYISGWHRGQSGKLEKLIAYSPLHIGAENEKQIWSVAVVAPISEVEKAVQSVYVRQNLIQGSIVVVVVMILAFYIVMERIWLRTLERRVEEKTSDLEQYAKMLRRSEEKYRSLVESADDMIYTLNKSCRIVSVNKFYTHLTGQMEKEAIGQKITDVIQYENPDRIKGIIESVLRTSRTIDHEEKAIINDKEYFLDTKYKPIKTSEDQTSAILVISRDITEHKNFESQLIHTERLASLGSLSAGVAHEINNPIAIISGFTEMLLEKIPATSKEHEFLKTIERQADNCQKIVENLLTFSRMPEETDTETGVAANLERVLNVVKNTLVTKKIELHTDIEPDLPKVRGDGQALEQVFMNIINNAIAAMESGGILTIKAYCTGYRVNISFSDTGHGIPKDIMGKIFEPFFTTKKVGEGTGLGLSLSYGIIKKFGGSIQVSSRTSEEEEEGSPGTTFTILLPLVE